MLKFKNTFLFGLLFLSAFKLYAGVIGSFADVVFENGQYKVYGWACDKGPFGVRQTSVALSFHDANNTTVFSTGMSANQSIKDIFPEANRSDKCGVGNYGFSYILNQAKLVRFSGKSIYVNAISTQGQVNLKINNSGIFFVPKPPLPSTAATAFSQNNVLLPNDALSHLLYMGLAPNTYFGGSKLAYGDLSSLRFAQVDLSRANVTFSNNSGPRPLDSTWLGSTSFIERSAFKVNPGVPEIYSYNNPPSTIRTATLSSAGVIENEIQFILNNDRDGQKHDEPGGNGNTSINGTLNFSSSSVIRPFAAGPGSLLQVSVDVKINKVIKLPNVAFASGDRLNNVSLFLIHPSLLIGTAFQFIDVNDRSKSILISIPIFDYFRVRTNGGVATDIGSHKVMVMSPMNPDGTSSYVTVLKESRPTLCDVDGRSTLQSCRDRNTSSGQYNHFAYQVSYDQFQNMIRIANDYVRTNGGTSFFSEDPANYKIINSGIGGELGTPTNSVAPGIDCASHLGIAKCSAILGFSIKNYTLKYGSLP